MHGTGISFTTGENDASKILPLEASGVHRIQTRLGNAFPYAREADSLSCAFHRGERLLMATFDVVDT